jgi:hypothetical protein
MVYQIVFAAYFNLFVLVYFGTLACGNFQFQGMANIVQGFLMLICRQRSSVLVVAFLTMILDINHIPLNHKRIGNAVEFPDFVFITSQVISQIQKRN